MKAYRYAGDASALDAVARRVAEARADPARRSQVAGELAGVLASPASPEAKQFACRQLVTIAGPDQVPALAALLGEGELAHYALMALAVIPGKTVNDALLKALPAIRGGTRLEILDALADRREPRVLPLLRAELGSSDIQAADLAAFALARLGGSEALTALRQAFGSASGSRKRALGDALLALASAAGGKDRPAVVHQVALLLDRESANPALRAGALRLLVEGRGAKALPLLAAALREDGTPRQKVAVSLARQIPGSEATRALSRELPALTPAGRLLLIEALGDRADPAAAPALAAASRDSDPAARLAALKALGRVGDARTADLLLAGAASGEAQTREAARAALVELSAPGVEARLMEAMAEGPPERRVEAIRAVGTRKVTAALPALMVQAGSPDRTVSSAALRVLRDLGEPQQLQPLVSLLLAAPPGERDELMDTVASVARRGSDEEQRTGALLRALNASTRPADRADLLNALGQVGGPGALAALRAAAAGADPETKLAALTFLAEWPTDEPLEDLLRLSRAGDEKLRTIALRGYLRMVGVDEQRPPARSLALYRGAAELIRRPEEKRLLLAGLGKLGSLEALEYAATFLKDQAVRPEAELAVVEAARWTVGAYREQTRAALEPIARESANEEVRGRARDLLALGGRFGDYLTAWEVSPAYRQEGADYRRLFDLPFPPEESVSRPDFAALPWRLMPAGATPQQPWLLDLLGLLGGEQRVAYLRTAIWSDTARDLVLELGSDDGIKAWWNGRVIVAQNTARAVAPGQEKVSVTVQPGWNHLLLKVTQNNQGWGAVARLSNPDGSQPAGLRYAVPSAAEPATR